MTGTHVPRRGTVRLAAGHRLQAGPSADSHVLVNPQGVVQLNETAAAILALCDGTRTREELAREVLSNAGAGSITVDCREFIDAALQLGWIKDD